MLAPVRIWQVPTSRTSRAHLVGFSQVLHICTTMYALIATGVVVRLIALFKVFEEFGIAYLIFIKVCT